MESAASVVSNLNTELLLFNINSSSSFPTPSCSLPLIGGQLSSRPRKKLINQRLCCVKLKPSTSVELERKLKADQMNPQGGDDEEEEEDWMMELGKLQVEKCCEEKSGMVEVMECLEKEAIMGEDQGREPTDYHRRAQIFDKSSRVFQALKERM